MKAAIVGAAGAGKSTVFHTLTGLAPLAAHGERRERARPGQMRLNDARLDALAEKIRPRKLTPIELTLLDFAPDPKEQQKPSAGLDPELAPLLRDVDALIVVVAQFGPWAGADPLEKARAFDEEMVFADYAQVERRLERLAKEHAEAGFEKKTLERFLGLLEQGKPLRAAEVSAQERRATASFSFLSLRPALLVLNCEPEAASLPINAGLGAALSSRRIDAVRLAAAFEAELLPLSGSERDELLQAAGLREPGRERLAAALYAALDLITFYTAGEQEVRAWPLARGATILEAAGKIHSDIARGFIRAEVLGFEEFVAAGSTARAREAGKLRLEGKTYVVCDGDIVHVRFKV
ncbi:MAG: DUF933 domain-containing protein [Deltaproteobacteria bacterium]|nr:DUF933 domain-containing protein [Deltaproteobacteria bacterium]